MSATVDTIHVVHVDDDPDFADMSASFLEREDERFNVRTATTPGKGLELVEEHDVDCIVSDYDMPQANGVEFLESVREEHPDLPFILYTGKGSEEVASEAISADVTDYLQKEAGTDQYTILANRIQNVVDQTRAERERKRMRERMELALEHTDSVIFELNRETGGVARHGAFEQFFDLPAGKVPTWKDYLDRAVHPADKEKFQQFYQRLVDGDITGGTLEYRTHPDQGSVRWIEDTVSIESEAADDSHLAIGIARDVTDYKEREQKLQQKERRYQAVFNDPNILVGRIDTDGMVLDINETAMEYIDRPIDEITGKPFWETPWFTHSESLQQEVKTWIDRASSGEYVEFEADLVRPNGDPYTVQGVFRPVTNEAGEVVSLLISDRDITEQKQHEQELERVRDFFTEAERLGDLGAWEFDSAGEAIWTEGTRRIHEVGDEFDPSVEKGIQFYHPDDRDRIRDAVERALYQGESYAVQARLITAEGAERWVRTRGEPVSEGSDPETVRGFIQDITAQKERERELQRYEELIETLPIGYVRTTPDGEFRAVNSTFVDMLDGDSQDDVLPRDVEEFYQDRTTREQVINTLRETGQVRDEELKVTTLTGETVWISLTAHVIDGDNGIFIDALGQDITERKAREQELEQTYEQMEFALDVTDSIIWVLDLETGNSIDYGPVERLFGIEPSGLTEFLESVVHSEDQAHMERVFEAIRAGDTDEFDVEYRTSPSMGETAWISATGYVRDGSEQSHPQLIGLATDVTDRKRRETELQRQNERLDQFNSIVSHDLRNPLNVASGHLQLAQEDCESDHLNAVEQAHARMESLITDLLTLAREGETATEITSVDLEALVHSCWRHVDTADASLVVDIGHSVRADESRLSQLFENLVRNAIEHGGGEVTVTVGGLDNGFYIEDDGAGIPEKARDDVFNAGYSTTEDGTGFGLSIVKQVVEAHDWEINVTQGSEGGARFEITGVKFAAH